MTFPDLSNSTSFPLFSTLPLASDTSSTIGQESYWLIATFKHEMTVSQYPTFICADLSGVQFALTLKIPDNIVQDHVQGGGYDVSRFKMGFSVVVKMAVRKGVDGAKQGYVGVDPDEVKVSRSS